MRRFFRSTLFILAVVIVVVAQDAASIDQRIESLRAQLRDVADREAHLQEHAQEIEEALKPENIQRSVAPIGTTDAEALRDQRRQQLEREKANVEGLLRSLVASRTNLETAIASAEAEAVRLRAAALSANNTPPQAETGNTNAPPAAQGKRGRRRTGKRPARRRLPGRRTSSPR
jgi:chromosome segregation ATPase